MINKTIKFFLKDFEAIPNSLINSRGLKEFLNVNLSQLYWHYYKDKNLFNPPKVNPLLLENLRFISNSTDFRFKKKSKQSRDYKRIDTFGHGQAFCRWFLYKYLGISYFAPISDFINNEEHKAFNRSLIKRVQKGDTPDFLCANKNYRNIFVAEAKGTFARLDFNSSKFIKWRAQFDRIQVINNRGRILGLKGFILASSFASINNKDRFTSLFVEDPEIKGEKLNSDDVESTNDLLKGILSIHYGQVLKYLNYDIIASALIEGFEIPDEYKFNFPIYRSNLDPLKNKQFIGYKVPISFDNAFLEEFQHYFLKRVPIDFRWFNINHQFVGLEYNILKILRNSIKGNWNNLLEINEYDDINTNENIDNKFTLYRDGSVVGLNENFYLSHFESI